MKLSKTNYLQQHISIVLYQLDSLERPGGSLVLGESLGVVVEMRSPHQQNSVFNVSNVAIFMTTNDLPSRISVVVQFLTSFISLMDRKEHLKLF